MGSGSLARGACLKLHSIILLPHKMWRQGPACVLTVPAMRKVREGLELKTFGNWLASPSTFGEAGKIGPVGALLGKVVPTHTNAPLSMICRAFEFHRQIKGCQELGLQHVCMHENQHKCRYFIPNPLKYFPIPVPNSSFIAGQNDVYSHVYIKLVTFFV